MERSGRNNMHVFVDESKFNRTARKTILIAEDEPELRLLLKMVLQDEHQVFEAEDGEQAMRCLESIRPDLIISDVMMPNMNGLELCNRVKNTMATCHIPFILLSARDTPEQQMEGYEVGADAYIAKPFHAEHLRIRIRKMVEQVEKLHQFFKNELPWKLEAGQKMGAEDQVFLDHLLQMIGEKMDDTHLHADHIGKALFLSKMQLYRKVKTLTGMTPGEFIKDVRLKHAAVLLTTTRLTVSEIFFRTGFNNQSYFFREFKKHYDLPPNEYRLNHAVHS